MPRDADRVPPAGRLRRRTAIAAATAVVVAAVAGHATAPGSARGPAVGRLTFGAMGAPVPSRFVGFSAEYWTLGRFLGLPGLPANPLLAPTVRDVGQRSPPVLRIGGNSADQSWPAGWPLQPDSARYAITDTWFARLASVLRHDGGSVDLTTNLAAGRPDAGAALLRRATRALPPGRIAAVQTGNEPDQFVRRRVAELDGRKAVLRRPGYGLTGVLRDQAAALRALRATGIPFALTGPGFASPRWRDLAPQYIASHPGLRSYASHVYALSACGGRRSGLRPDQLLADDATVGLAGTLAPELAAARAAHLPLIVQEGNSVACSGAHGVSDHPYSALWAADALAAMERAGVQSFRFHASGGSYDPFTFRFVAGHWQVRLAPEYLGIRLFEHALGPGARAVPVHGAPGGVDAWATRDARGVLRVLAVNRSTSRAATLLVRARRARVVTLTTHRGLRLGGRRFTGWRNDPHIALAPLERTVSARHGSLRIHVPAAAGAVATVG